MNFQHNKDNSEPNKTHPKLFLHLQTKMADQQVVPLPYDQMTTAQSMALALTLKFSSALSICGSGYLVYNILHPDSRAQKLKSMYNRIILKLSILDLVGSVALFMSTWPVPKDTLHDSWIWGNIGIYFEILVYTVFCVKVKISQHCTHCTYFFHFNRFGTFV